MRAARRLLLLTACAGMFAAALPVAGAHAQGRTCLPGAVADIDYELGLFEQQTSYDLQRLNDTTLVPFATVTLARSLDLTAASAAAITRGLQPAPCP